LIFAIKGLLAIPHKHLYIDSDTTLFQQFTILMIPEMVPASAHGLKIL
jgi:hypothetical protein